MTTVFCQSDIKGDLRWFLVPDDTFLWMQDSGNAQG
jgi:hypothetical protein